MTAVLHHFPTAPAYAAQREAATRRAEIVIAARAILRSAARHDDAILTEACVALQDYGDATDHLQADAMLLAVRLRASRSARDASATAKRPKPVIRLDEVALILSVAFAVGMGVWVGVL